MKNALLKLNHTVVKGWENVVIKLNNTVVKGCANVVHYLWIHKVPNCNVDHITGATCGNQSHHP